MPDMIRIDSEWISKAIRREVRDPMAKINEELLALRRLAASLEKRVRQLEQSARTPQPSLISEALLAKVPKHITAGKLKITGKTIKQLRERLELTQAQLSTLLDVSAQAVYLWERRAQGQLKLRGKSQQMIAVLNGMNKRDVHLLLSGAETAA